MQLKLREVVLVGRVVAMPGDHIERRVVDVGGPQIALKFGDDLEVALSRSSYAASGVRKSRAVGQAVGADRAELRQAEAPGRSFRRYSRGLRARAARRGT